MTEISEIPGSKPLPVAAPAMPARGDDLPASGGPAAKRPAMLGLQSILIALVLGGILVSSGGLHIAWWNTAKRNSTQLAGQIELHISEAVRREWWSRVTSAETAFSTASSLLNPVTTLASREKALTVTAAATPALSSIVHRPAQGDTLASVRVGDEVRVTKIDNGWPYIPRRVEPGWAYVAADPLDGVPAVVYVGVQPDGGLLGAFVQLGQFSQLLGSIAVGETGGTFVVGPDGRIVAAPSAPQNAMHVALAEVASLAGQRVAARPDSARDIVERVRIEHRGEGFAVALSPLNFQGWQFAVIIPEAEYLASIEQTTQRVAIGLAVFVALGGLIAVIIARRALVAPIRAVVGDLAHVERFELDRIPERQTGIAEIDQLSAAIGRMSAGLADFGKFIPTDLVRALVADGVRAEPGGELRTITVMFADIVGFTTMSERAGTGVIDIVSRYFEVSSNAVTAHRGVVDKFIGDAVMALWGAPRRDGEQALNACRAALAMTRAMEDAGIVDDEGQPMRLRIGIHTGEAIVGNIGSRSRLNYTAIGDSVNLASRIEGVSKLYGTRILISEATRAGAGAGIITREIDRITVYGRTMSVAIFELVGLADDSPVPPWIGRYEDGLSLYRERRFGEAVVQLRACLALRPEDGPAAALMERCQALIATPPGEDWQPVTIIDSK